MTFAQDELARLEIDIRLGRSRKCFDWVEKLEIWAGELRQQVAREQKTLECSSAGDKRFSALFAVVEAYGKLGTIENHFQCAKRFHGEDPPKTWREAKGRAADWMSFGGKQLDKAMLPQLYSLLWAKFLDQHPDLVEHASQFEYFTDKFAQPGHVSQARCIEIYIKQGRRALIAGCRDLLGAL